MGKSERKTLKREMRWSEINMNSQFQKLSVRVLLKLLCVVKDAQGVNI